MSWNKWLCPAHSTSTQVKFKATMLKSSLCEISKAYIITKGTIAGGNTAAPDAHVNNANKKIIIKKNHHFDYFIDPSF